MKKGIACFLLIFVILVTFSGCGGFAVDYYPDAGKYMVGDAEIDGKIEKIDMNWVAGEITIKSYDGETVRLTETSGNLPEEERVHWYLDGTTLRVQFEASGLRIRSTVNKNIEISVPASLCLEELSLSCASAGMRVEGLNVEKMKVQSASGDFYGSFRKIGTCGIDTASGDVEISAENDDADISADTASGNIRFSLPGAEKVNIDSASGKVDLSFASSLPEECDVETASGDITFAFPENASFRLEFDTASGDFDCEFPIRKSGDVYIGGDGDSKFSVDTASGDLSVIVLK